MKVIDDGVIKFDRSNFSPIDSIPLAECENIEYWRKKLHQLKLIGEEPQSKIGYGNISEFKDYQSFLKTDQPQFIITGTQTGKHPSLNGTHYTRILNYEIENSKIWSMGAIEPSAESLTHAALYLSNPEIKAVIHIHSHEIWSGLISEQNFITDENIEYGTDKMALAAYNFGKKTKNGFFAMKGHLDGVIIYDENLEKAFLQTERFLKKYKIS